MALANATGGKFQEYADEFPGLEKVKNTEIAHGHVILNIFHETFHSKRWSSAGEWVNASIATCSFLMNYLSFPEEATCTFQ